MSPHTSEPPSRLRERILRFSTFRSSRRWFGSPKGNDRCRVHPPRRGYIFVEFHGEIEIERAATNLGEAVWFGCMTGGLDGKINVFDSQRIRLAPTNEPPVFV